MTRKIGLLVMMLVALLAAACGAAGGGVTLSETYDSGGISFKYPSGWLVQGSDTGIVTMANSQAALDAMDAAGPEFKVEAGQLMMSILPITGDIASAMGATQPAELLRQMSGGMSGDEDSPQFGEPSEVTIAGKTGARASGSSDSVDAQIVVLKMGDAGYAVVIGIAPKGDLSKLEGTLTPIAETLSLTAAAG